MLSRKPLLQALLVEPVPAVQGPDKLSKCHDIQANGAVVLLELRPVTCAVQSCQNQVTNFDEGHDDNNFDDAGVGVRWWWSDVIAVDDDDEEEEEEEDDSLLRLQRSGIVINTGTS